MVQEGPARSRGIGRAGRQTGAGVREASRPGTRLGDEPAGQDYVRYASPTLRIMAEITYEKALSAVRTKIAAEGGIAEDDISADIALSDLGLDSVQVLSVVTGLESEFGLDSMAKDSGPSETAGELAARVAERGNA